MFLNLPLIVVVQRERDILILSQLISHTSYNKPLLNFSAKTTFLVEVLTI